MFFFIKTCLFSITIIIVSLLLVIVEVGLANAAYSDCFSSAYHVLLRMLVTISGLARFGIRHDRDGPEGLQRPVLLRRHIRCSLEVQGLAHR